MIFVSGIFKEGGTENLKIKGILFGVSAAIIYATVILLNKHLKNISSYGMTVMQIGIAAMILLPYTVATQNFGNLSFDFLAVVLLLVVGILNTGITYSLYFSSIKELKAQTIAIFSYIDPIVAILLSTFLLKEKPDIYTVIGGILILGATFVSELQKD